MPHAPQRRRPPGRSSAGPARRAILRRPLRIEEAGRMAHVQSAARPAGPAAAPRSRSPARWSIFGVTGDLSRKKLHPGRLRPGQPRSAAARLRAAGLRPPRLGRRRLPSSPAYAAAKKHARTAVARGGLAAAGQQLQFVPGSFDDDNAFDQLAGNAGRARERHGIGGQRRVLPLHPAGRVPDWCSSRWSAPGWPTTPSPAAGAGWWSRSRSATTWQSAES